MVETVEGMHLLSDISLLNNSELVKRQQIREPRARELALKKALPIKGFGGNFLSYSIGILHFFQFLVNLLFYWMGILYFSQFPSIFYVIQWETCIFLLFVNFPCYSMESLYFFNYPCCSMGIWVLRSFGGGGGRTYGRTDGRLEIHLCVLQDIGPLGPLPKKGDHNPPTDRPTDRHSGV